MANYEYDLLPVGDADAIIIRYFKGDEQFIIVIDAGNIGDGEKIKNHIETYYNTDYIDLAICTHPDKDHKDGFFELLNDGDITINEFWLTDPAEYLDEDDFKRYSTKEGAEKAVRRIWNKSDDESQNLIDLALKKCDSVINAIDGREHDELPIYIAGPTAEYYTEVVKNMVADYGIKTYDESEKSKYDAAYQISEDEAKSVIDAREDPSPYNASSLIVMFEPNDGKSYLFAGDANTTSLRMMLDEYERLRNVDFLKVPHHGSQYNLDTGIIDEL